MYCTTCGKLNHAGAGFCAHCGAEMVPPPEQAESPPASDPDGAPVAETDEPDEPKPEPEDDEPEPEPEDEETKAARVAQALRAHRLARLALLVSVLGSVTGVGIIMGIIAYRGVKRAGGTLKDTRMAQMAVVVGVISILAAILFPVFARAREKARLSSCLSNEKQLAVGMAMYCQDYDELHPLTATWCDGIDPYVKNLQVFNCPSQPDQPFGYAMNAQLDQVRTGVVYLPAETVSLFDATGGQNLSGGPEVLVARHLRGVTVAYDDGHCRWHQRPPEASWFDPRHGP